MESKPYPFENLPFSKLFKAYTAQNPDLLQFFESSPFEEQQVTGHANSFKFSGDRRATAEALLFFNSNLKLSDAARSQIDRLADSSSLAVVTGQQSVVLGGPLFTVYKALTALILAKRYENLLNRPVIPVFWLADEDHDYEEVAALQVKNREGLIGKRLAETEGSPRVSEIHIDSSIDAMKKTVRDALPDTDFSDDVWALINRAYREGEGLTSAFAVLLNDLFGKHGLVIAGSNSDKVKELVKPVLKDAVSKADEIHDALESQSARLEKSGYHRQVAVQPGNLFRIDDEGNRIKLIRDGNIWRQPKPDGTFREFSSDDLIEEIDRNPNGYSPNVFLRPVLQDRLLPVLAYVGGPGEIAYYAQIKRLYPVFGQKMPVIAPRFSATILESGVSRVMDQLPFELHDYQTRIEDLISDFVDQADTPDVNAIFDDWKKELNEITEQFKPKIAEVDPTLEATAGKVGAGFNNELDKLKGKVFRSIKQQESVQIKRIERISNSLFPDGSLQERELAWIWLANKYGLSVFDELLTCWEEADPGYHQIITP